MYIPHINPQPPAPRGKKGYPELEAVPVESYRED